MQSWKTRRLAPVRYDMATTPAIHMLLTSVSESVLVVHVELIWRESGEDGLDNLAGVCLGCEQELLVWGRA